MKPTNPLQKPRVIAGSAKGIKLDVPFDARPVTDRTKQSVFDLIIDFIPDAIVVDLFAGSGAMGIEALSRGAQLCEFVDHSIEALDIINKNLETTRLTPKAALHKLNVYKFIKEAKITFDIIFCDPPFDRIEEFEFHKLRKLLHENSILVLKYPSNLELPNFVTMPLVHSKKFGNNQIGFYKLEARD